VGIGTTNPTTTLEVDGTIKSTNATFTNATIGAFYSTGITMGGDLIPAVTDTYSLGTATNRWKELHVAESTIFIGGKPLSVVGDRFSVDRIEIIDTREAQSITSGAFVVAGGMAVRKNLRVGGNAIVDGDLSVLGTLTAVNRTESNILNENVTLGTLNLTFGQVVNATITSLSSNNFSAGSIAASSSTLSNIVTTNITGSSIRLSGTGIIPTLTSTTITSASVRAGSGTISNLFAPDFRGSTATLTHLFSTSTGTIANLRATSITVPNIAVTNVTASSLRITSTSGLRVGAGGDGGIFYSDYNKYGVTLGVSWILEDYDDSTGLTFRKATTGRYTTLRANNNDFRILNFNGSTTRTDFMISSSGFVGIGNITNPTSTLHVGGNVFSTQSFIGSNVSVSGTVSTGTLRSEFIRASTNVGIGTASPSVPLHVVSTTNNPVQVQVTNAASNAAINLTNN